MRLKIEFRGETRRVKPAEIGTEVTQFENLIRFIVETYPDLVHGFLLKYSDEDGM